MSGTGYGYQLPQDSNTEEAGWAFIARRLIAKLQTMTLCQVMTITGGGGAIAAAGTVDVQLLVNQIDGATPPNSTPRGLVTEVPYFRVAGGKNAIICDPQVNDIGYIIAADRDTSVVKTTFAQANPGSRRTYSYSDGVYTPLALNVTPNQYLVFTSTGVRLVDMNGNSLAMSSSGITWTDSSGNMIQSGSSGFVITSSGDFTVNGISLLHHVHTGVTTGTSDTGPPVG